MGKHSKLPFKISGRMHYGEPALYRITLRDAQENVVAFVDCGIASTGEINAAFIIRACNSHDDLLAALTRVCDTLQVNESMDCTQTRKSQRHMLKQVQAVIAKASGTSA